MDKSVQNIFKSFAYFISKAMEILVKEDFKDEVYMDVRDYQRFNAQDYELDLEENNEIH